MCKVKFEPVELSERDIEYLALMERLNKELQESFRRMAIGWRDTSSFLAVSKMTALVKVDPQPK